MTLHTTAIPGAEMETSFEAQLEDAMQRAFVGAVRLLGSREAARDACQEAATRALAARHRYDSSRPFYPWFYRIMRNHCLDVLGRRGRTTDDGQAVIEHTRSHERSAEATVIASEQERAVLDAIEHLNDNHRLIIEMRHFQDLSYDDMAELLDCPIGTVMSRLYRARKALREALLDRGHTWRTQP